MWNVLDLIYTTVIVNTAKANNKKWFVCPNKEMKKRVGRSIYLFIFIFFEKKRHFEKKTW